MILGWASTQQLNEAIPPALSHNWVFTEHNASPSCSDFGRKSNARTGAIGQAKTNGQAKRE